MTRSSTPAPDRFVREIAIFSRSGDGSWRRDDERHDNELVDTTTIPALLARVGVHATVGVTFGGERLPSGLRVVLGTRPATLP